MQTVEQTNWRFYQLSDIALKASLLLFSIALTRSSNFRSIDTKTNKELNIYQDWIWTTIKAISYQIGRRLGVIQFLFFPGTPLDSPNLLHNHDWKASVLSNISCVSKYTSGQYVEYYWTYIVCSGQGKTRKT